MTRAVNSDWCLECHRHKTVCICDPIVNIYLIEYKLIINSGLHHSWCEGKLRCVAFDTFQAMSKVQDWILAAKHLRLVDENTIERYELPAGDRDLSIKTVSIYAENVGELLKSCPLPEVFEHEE